MIDPNLLRQLGWKEDLISEVTRMADKINKVTIAFPNLKEPLLHRRITSGSTLHIDDSEINTSVRLFHKVR